MRPKLRSFMIINTIGLVFVNCFTALILFLYKQGVPNTIIITTIIIGGLFLIAIVVYQIILGTRKELHDELGSLQPSLSRRSKTLYIFSLVVLCLALIFQGSSYIISIINKDTVVKEGKTICPQDIQQCPDGSYVRRTEPNCEFEECPVAEPITSNTNFICPQDTKQCLDGSYVSRTGTNCEFTECSIVATSSSDAENRMASQPTDMQTWKKALEKLEQYFQTDSTLISLGKRPINNFSTSTTYNYLDIVNYNPYKKCDDYGPNFIPDFSKIDTDWIQYDTHVTNMAYISVWLPNKIKYIGQITRQFEPYWSDIYGISFGGNNGSWVKQIRILSAPGGDSSNYDNLIAVMNHRSSDEVKYFLLDQFKVKQKPTACCSTVGLSDDRTILLALRLSAYKIGYGNGQNDYSYQYDYELVGLIIEDESSNPKIIEIRGPGEGSECNPGRTLEEQSYLFVSKYYAIFQNILREVKVYYSAE